MGEEIRDLILLLQRENKMSVMSVDGETEVESVSAEGGRSGAASLLVTADKRC